MSYNETPRRRFTAEQRTAFLQLHNCTCYWCGELIAHGEPWDVEHMMPREMMPGKEADADHNLRPIHSHPKPCHKIKTARDRKVIAKSNRIRRASDPETRRQSKNPIRSRKAAWPKRAFEKRVKPWR
jgi:hypothetical protein